MEVSMEIRGERLELVELKLKSRSIPYHVEQVGMEDLWQVTVIIPDKGRKRWIRRHERTLTALGFPEVWEARTLAMLDSLEFSNMPELQPAH